MIALKVGPDLRMAVVASPAYLARHGAPAHPGDLIQHRCINYRMLAARTIYAWEFAREDKAFEVRVPGPLIFNDPALMLECALEGLGVAYLPENEITRSVGDGQLVRLLLDWTQPFPGFHIYYSSRQQVRPILAAFLQASRGRQA